MKKKIIILLLSILSILTVHRIYAYLIDETETLTNNFTIGKNYLKIFARANSDTEPAFDNNYGIKKSEIEKVYTINTLELPSDLQDNIIEKWDVSEKQNGSIIAYALDTDSNLKYEIYIGQDGGVWANPDSKKAFDFYTKLDYADLSNLITDDVTTMAGLFQGNTSLKSIDVSGWDTSKVTTMKSMFQLCSHLTDLDVSGFVTSEVTDMSYMFYGCSALKNIDVSSWDTSKVTTFMGLFYNCKSLESLDVSGFVTSEVTNMSHLFYNCFLLSNLEVSGWNTSKVKTMRSLFYGCSSLTDLDVSGFVTSEVTDMSYLFNDCSSLLSLNISDWDVSKVTSTKGMFQNCKSLQTLNIPNNFSRLDDYMFNHVESLDVETFTISKTVKIIGKTHIFYNFGKEGKFKEFVVEDGNTAFKTIDGILYSYDGTKLIDIPRDKTFENNKFEIPEGITFMNELSFSRNKNIETLVLPNSYEIERYIDKDNNSYGFVNSGSSLNLAIYRYTSISKYEVKDDNIRYSSYEGCIYSKDGTELIAIPLHYDGILNIKSGTEVIGQQALWNGEGVALNDIKSITTINIPASVITIDTEQLTLFNELAAKGVTINIDSANTSYQMSNGQIVEI